MNSEDFRRYGYEMIDYVASFRETIDQRPPLADVQPGFLHHMLWEKKKMRKSNRMPNINSKLPPPPEKPESFSAVMNDIESCVMQGMTHWQHPHFHAYQPSGNSWSSVLANIICNGLGANSATWSCCPAATELEMIVLDWVAKFLNIPHFYYSTFSNSVSKGGGAIQASSSEAMVVALISAREHAINKLLKKEQTNSEASLPSDSKRTKLTRVDLKSKLICYCNGSASPLLEKAAVTMADVKLRMLEPESDGKVSAETLYSAIREDIKKGLVPFFLSANLGSGPMTSFDDLMELGPICEAYHIWLHADCDYAGSSFCCPEFKYLTSGLQFTCSMSIDCSKWMLATNSTSILWVKHKNLLMGPFSSYSYLGNDEQTPNATVEEFQHWGISTTRSFRALKLWMVIRSYGVNGIRNYIRRHCVLAKHFENHVLRDGRFEVVGETRFGVCCFAYVGTSDASNHLTQRLLEGLNSSRKIFLIPGSFQSKFFIRFSVCYENATKEHIDFAWNLIKDYAGIINRLYPAQTKEISKEIPSSENHKVFLQTSSLQPEKRKIWNDLKMYYNRCATANASSTAVESSQTNDVAVQISSWVQDITQTVASLQQQPKVYFHHFSHENEEEGKGKIDNLFSTVKNTLKLQTVKILDAEKIVQDVRATLNYSNSADSQSASTSAASVATSVSTASTSNSSGSNEAKVESDANLEMDCQDSGHNLN